MRLRKNRRILTHFTMSTNLTCEVFNLIFSDLVVIKLKNIMQLGSILTRVIQFRLP